MKHESTAPGERRLNGRRIAIPEHRELDRLADMLEREGALAVRCPLMAILDAPDPEPVTAWLRACCAGAFHDVIFLTGEGVVRLHDAATRVGIKDEFLRAMGKARTISRGPKPARALHTLGIKVSLAPGVPTSQGIADVLRGHVLEGRHVGLQLFGDNPSEEFVGFLTGKGAIVHAVAPYRYAPASDEARVIEIVADIARGSLDAIAFTSALQIERLIKVADAHETRPALLTGLAGMHVAAVGPIVVETLQRHGVRVDSVPGRQFFMRRLVEAMVESLGPAPVAAQ